MVVIDLDDKAIMYIMHHFDFWLSNLIAQVLEDSDDDPEFSAVTASNCIKCYIQVMKDFKQPIPYQTVKEYILQEGFTESEYEIFEQKRNKESKYYIGEQF